MDGAQNGRQVFLCWNCVGHCAQSGRGGDVLRCNLGKFHSLRLFSPEEEVKYNRHQHVMFAFAKEVYPDVFQDKGRRGETGR